MTKKEILSHLEPQAKKAIDTCKKNKAFLTMMVDGFQTEKEALYLMALLWYARENGVEVRIIS